MACDELRELSQENGRFYLPDLPNVRVILMRGVRYVDASLCYRGGFTHGANYFRGVGCLSEKAFLVHHIQSADIDEKDAQEMGANAQNGRQTRLTTPDTEGE